MFKQKLEEIMERADGSIGALIMGTDGIAVEKVLRPDGRDANLDIAAAEFTSLIRNAQRTSSDTGLGGLRELVVMLDSMCIILRLLSREYFFVLAMRADGNLGRGRFELRKAELEFAKEFVL